MIRAKAHSTIQRKQILNYSADKFYWISEQEFRKHEIKKRREIQKRVILAAKLETN
jgi:hypothetical protein